LIYVRFSITIKLSIYSGNFMIEKFLLFLHSFVLNWAFVLGFIFSILTFSQYIFRPKNLYSDAKEVLEILNEKHNEQHKLNNLIYHHRYKR